MPLVSDDVASPREGFPTMLTVVIMGLGFNFLLVLLCLVFICCGAQKTTETEIHDTVDDTVHINSFCSR